MNFFDKSFKENHDRIYVIDASSSKEYAYADSFKIICGLEVFLKNTGLVRGDRFSVCLKNSPLFAFLYFAAFKSGLTIVPINVSVSADEMAFILKNSRAKLIVSSSDDRLELKIPMDFRHIRISINDVKKTEDFSWHGSEEVFPIIHYTSGTTAKPKGLVHRISSYARNAAALSKMFSFSKENRFFNTLPMSYMAGFYNLIFLPFLNGGSVLIADAFSPSLAIKYWDLASRHSVNTLWLVPSIASILTSIDRGSKGSDYCRFSIMTAISGTAPLSSTIKQNFEEKYGIELFDGYGLSETLFVTTNSPAGRKTGSTGKTLEGININIDSAGMGEGEIIIRSPDIMAGYLDENSGELQPAGDGFRTGDLGIVDSDGFLFITGRSKDLIIKGGVNINPLSIENVVSGLEGVKEASVIGVPHPHLGEDIVLFIVLKENAIAGNLKQAVLEHCRNRLSQENIPSAIIEIKSFPKTSSGKVQKNKLKDIYNMMGNKP
jgi:long-chain acyl-CoA synthetase